MNFILDRRQKLAAARKDGKKEKKMETFINSLGLSANPRSAVTLHEMGYSKELCALALQKSNNDIPQAQFLLQSSQNELRAELAETIKPDAKLVDNLVSFGFDSKLVESILKQNTNDFQKALDALLEMQKDPNSPQRAMDLMNQISGSSGPSTSSESSASGSEPTTSGSESSSSTSDERKKSLMEKTLAENAAFDELRNDLDHLDDDDEYLTITLEKEQLFLQQYKNALGN